MLLTTSVHKWRRAWVAPQGLQPESSYKVSFLSIPLRTATRRPADLQVYKWVRVDDKVSLDPLLQILFTGSVLLDDLGSNG